MNATRNNFRPQLEALEERLAPVSQTTVFDPITSALDNQLISSFNSREPTYQGGILSIQPRVIDGDNTADHLHPSVGVAGLNKAEANSGVLSWTPTFLCEDGAAGCHRKNGG